MKLASFTERELDWAQGSRSVFKSLPGARPVAQCLGLCVGSQIPHGGCSSDPSPDGMKNMSGTGSACPES